MIPPHIRIVGPDPRDAEDCICDCPPCQEGDCDHCDGGTHELDEYNPEFPDLSTNPEENPE